MSTSPPASPSSSRDAVADLIAARLATATSTNSAAEERANQEEKRGLRRIIYAGIERHNDAKLAVESIRTLYKLSKNIIDHPGESNYQQFKPTNKTIQRTLIEPPSALEFAIAVGFRADVQNFQPYYRFTPSPKSLNSLKNGLECLQEYIDREDAKILQNKSAKETLKDMQARQRELVKLAYEDDRREKQRRDEMERQRRDAVAEAHAKAALLAEEKLERERTEAAGEVDPPPYGAPDLNVMPPIPGGITLGGEDTVMGEHDNRTDDDD